MDQCWAFHIEREFRSDLKQIEFDTFLFSRVLEHPRKPASILQGFRPTAAALDRNVKQFARSSIRLRGISLDLPSKSHDIRDDQRNFADRVIDYRSHID